MEFQTIHLRCSHCSHEWDGKILSNCSLPLAAASMKELDRQGCSACGMDTTGTVRWVFREVALRSEKIGR